nr:conotoxin precursor Cerm08 [Conus judaeus]DAZ86568.1 TPA_inf: conotoxin precursor Cerm08 [Conus judaeus]
MMLFMFAAITFTMASATVTLDTCASAKVVCAWAGQGESCSCSATHSCTQDDAHKVEVNMERGVQALYTCQQISDFDKCTATGAVMPADLSQLYCRCSNNKYTIENDDVVCG